MGIDACANVSLPAMEDLAPVAELGCDDEGDGSNDTSNVTLFQSGPSVSSSSLDSSSLRSYAANAAASNSCQILHKWEGAMEALPVLSYNQVHNDVHQIDLLLVILAFFECGSFFTDLQKECMSLWRVTMSQDDDDNLDTADWINKYPMFDGWNAPAGVAVDLVQAELQTPCQLLLSYGAGVLDHQRG
eukprot:2111687-Ditylum_brightwellii.AAC.1